LTRLEFVQVADYATRFTCYPVDLRGAGLSGKPDGEYTTELLADDVAAFMRTVGISSAHVSGLSLGAATGMWLAAKYPSLVRSLSLHSAWTATDPYLKAVVQGWRTSSDTGRKAGADGDALEAAQHQLRSPGDMRLSG
jgi:pimeloyl-ACP methyl ester carboxylesterase